MCQVTSLNKSTIAHNETLFQALRDDLVEDPAFRNRQQASEGPVTASHFLHTYVNYLKCRRTVDRNLVMIAGTKAKLEEQGERICF